MSAHTKKGFAHTIDPARMITIGIESTQIDGRVYSNLRLQDMFVEVARQVKKFTDANLQRPTQAELVGGPDEPVTAASLSPRYQRFFKPNDIVLAETGTSGSGCSGPSRVKYRPMLRVYFKAPLPLRGEVG